MDTSHNQSSGHLVTGHFEEINGERFYAIKRVDQMPAFFSSVVSNSDLWMFVSSTGGLTAGRVSPETALFPYIPVDQIHQSWSHTGPKTILEVEGAHSSGTWEPFNQEHRWRYVTERNIYKSALGNKILFEETNPELGLTFRYTWMGSEKWGFIRKAELINQSDRYLRVKLLDGLQNVLPAGVPRLVQTQSSNLVDAYKRTELDLDTGLALFTLYSGITDRAEPCESLRSNTVFSIGLDNASVSICGDVIQAFQNGKEASFSDRLQGQRGGYFLTDEISLSRGEVKSWSIIANLEQSQASVASLRKTINASTYLEPALRVEVEHDSDELARIMGRSDAFQVSHDTLTTEHHYSNVVFNNMRGGVFSNHYLIPKHDFLSFLSTRNKLIAQQHYSDLAALPEHFTVSTLMGHALQQEDSQLERLCREYLPLTFGRRHGDPSRPWNQFSINLKDKQGQAILSYEGNWRDIFQNWEALALSYPEFLENMIAVFVNASTVDGFNPYRLTKEGIDWEVEDPEDPWSYIGYWGDHQIIYLLKLLELSQQFHPERLANLLDKTVFCYANVPYRIKPYNALLSDPKNTVEFDADLAAVIEQRVEERGTDGKLVWGSDGKVYLVNLYEKLLIPLLSKLGNLVVEGGIWMNTQRPEWNDANNALVGQGLSMVTLYYLRRYLVFMQPIFSEERDNISLSSEVSDWIKNSLEAYQSISADLNEKPVSDEHRYLYLQKVGESFSRYRQRAYASDAFKMKQDVPTDQIRALLSSALTVIDHSIRFAKGDNGLYHAYNLLNQGLETIGVEQLYPMLEGQVAALSSGSMSASEVTGVIDSLFASDVYRPDQDTFMLYPDRPATDFLDKNQVNAKHAYDVPTLRSMLDGGDTRLIEQDVDQCIRFNPELHNQGELSCRLHQLATEYNSIEKDRQAIFDLYERVFSHNEFTGRSGGMFGFEGLGCIYWHMVSKLLLAIQENFFDAVQYNAESNLIKRLGAHYYRVRQGLGFNKSPAEFGAFPLDAYSHTPKHAGAQQPGMTGQVKEEILTRFGELGVQVSKGSIQFNPSLLRESEFVHIMTEFRYLDISDNWLEIQLKPGSLAFSWCQIPIIYELNDSQPESIHIVWENHERSNVEGLVLSPDLSQHLFKRDGKIKLIKVTFSRNLLFQS